MSCNHNCQGGIYATHEYSCCEKECCCKCSKCCTCCVGRQGPQGPQGIQGPPGPQGPVGQAASVNVGTTTVGAPGTPASVTNSGTSQNAVLTLLL